MRIVIIGAGLAGLTFGAAAAKDGHEVLLLDKNAEPGGVMTLARQDGFSFEQGPLILTDLEPGGKIYKFLDKLRIHLDTIRDDRGLSTPDFELIPPEKYAGRNWRKKKLMSLFPEDKAGIREYYRFYETMMAIQYHQSQPLTFSHKLGVLLSFLKIRKYENMTCQQFTETLFSNEKLRMVFNGILADFCADPNEVQCFLLPFVNTETAFDKRIPQEKKGKRYYPVYSYYKGGCQKLPEALCEYIKAHGGFYMPGTVVEKVLTEEIPPDGKDQEELSFKATGVRLSNGAEITADVVVGSGAAKDFFEKTVGLELLDDEYREILEKFRPMEAVFMVHLGVDYDPSEYQKQSLCYYYNSYDLHAAVEELRSGIYHEGKEGYLIYFPDRHAPEFAPEGCHCVTIYTVCPDTLAEGTWEEKKEEYADKLIRLAEEHLPGLSKHIVTRKIVTAEDYRVLTHMEKSSFGGSVPIWKQKNPPYLTPVKNLVFVGAQSQSGGGVPVVLDGALAAYKEWKTETL